MKALPFARKKSRCREPVSLTRSGFTLLEVSVATVLLVTLMAISVQVLARVADERIASQRRQWATQEAANLMDRMTAMPWHDLHSGQSTQELSAAAREFLPSGHVEMQIIDEPSDLLAKRLTVEVHWQGRTGQAMAPVRLTSWVYKRGGNE